MTRRFIHCSGLAARCEPVFRRQWKETMVKKNAEHMKRAVTLIKKIRPAKQGNSIFHLPSSGEMSYLSQQVLWAALNHFARSGVCIIVFELFTLNLQAVNFLGFVTIEIISNHLRVIEKITRKSINRFYMNCMIKYKVRLIVIGIDYVPQNKIHPF